MFDIAEAYEERMGRWSFLLALLVKDTTFIDVFLGDSFIEASEKVIPIELGRPDNERPALVDYIEWVVTPVFRLPST